MPDLQFDFLPFTKGSETLALDGRMMHEDVAFGRLDEAVSLRVAKPLHLAGDHLPVSFPNDPPARRAADVIDTFLTPMSYGVLG